MNDSWREGNFEGDFVETGNNCAGLMTAAHNYFKALQSKIKTSESHKGQFNDERDQGDNTFSNRMKHFEWNMNKWGRRFDHHGCYCDQQVTDTIQAYADDVPNRVAGKNLIKKSL